MQRYFRAGESSIVWQTFGGMLLICMMPLLIISYQSYHCSKQAIVQLQSEALNAQIHSKEIQIRNWLEERQKDLLSLAENTCIFGCASTSKDSDCRLVNLASARDQIYEELYLYDDNWSLLNHYPEELEHSPTDLLTTEQKKQVMKGNEFIFSSPHTHIEGTLSVHVACRLMADDETKGFAVAVLNATRAISSILRDEKSPYIVRILDESGLNILEPQQNSFDFISKLPENIVRGTQELQRYENETGVSVIGVSRLLPYMNWTLIIESQANETFRWLSILRRRAFFTGLASLLLTVIVAVFLTRSITRPFENMAAAARKISSGNTEFRVKTWRGKEQRDLALAFNEMLDALESLRVELTQQSTLATIGQLSSSIVHEMRNPLSSISMNLQALRKKVTGDSLHEELAEIAQQQTDRLEHLLNELLKFGKPIVLNKKYIPYSELMALIQQDAKPILHKTSIRLNIRDLPDVTVPMYVDKEKMRQVFANLIENAVHASEENGEITLVTAIESGQLKITVQDTGSGIPAQLLSELFYPFVTGHSNGTGLGLANVKKIVELHGGTISATNRDSGGAEFTLLLPLTKKEEV